MPNNDARAANAPYYMYQCGVDRVVDGDTIDIIIDLGFEIQTTARTRLAGVDTRETYGVDHDSEEYQRGMAHKHAVADWITQTVNEVPDDYPFILYSQEYDRGKYGRVLADFWSPYHEEWLTEYLLSEFDDVEVYE